MNYIGGFLMLTGVFAMGVSMLGLALSLLDPVTGGTVLAVAVLLGAVGAELMSRWEST